MEFPLSDFRCGCTHSWSKDKRLVALAVTLRRKEELFGVKKCQYCGFFPWRVIQIFKPKSTLSTLYSKVKDWVRGVLGRCE